MVNLKFIRNKRFSEMNTIHQLDSNFPFFFHQCFESKRKPSSFSILAAFSTSCKQGISLRYFFLCSISGPRLALGFMIIRNPRNHSNNRGLHFLIHAFQTVYCLQRRFVTLSELHVSLILYHYSEEIQLYFSFCLLNHHLMSTSAAKSFGCITQVTFYSQSIHLFL